MPALLINIDVPDLDAAIRFYQAGIDLALVRRLFDGSVAELSDGTCTLYLLEKPAGSAPFPGAGVQRDYGRHWTPVHVDFVVADIEASAERACKAGATLEAPIEDHVWGRLARLSDPFGNGFCLVQWRGRGYDEPV